MATKTFYILGTAAAAPSWNGNLQDGGTAPTAANSSFGYKPAKTTAPVFFKSFLGASASATTSQASSYISGASGPTVGTGATNTTAGDSFSTSLPYSGFFAAGAWTLSLMLRAGTAGAVGHLNMRVWASTSIDGSSGVRELTSGSLVGTAVTLSTTADVNGMGTTGWTAPQITLNNEYLFFQLEWQETTTGSATQDDVLFRVGTCLITTTNFTNFISAGLAPSQVLTVNEKFLMVAKAAMAPTTSFGADAQKPIDAITWPVAASMVVTETIIRALIGGGALMGALGRQGLGMPLTLKYGAVVTAWAGSALLVPVANLVVTEKLLQTAKAALAPAPALGADIKTFVFDLSEALNPAASFGSSSIQRMIASAALAPTTVATVNEAQRLAAAAVWAPLITLGADLTRPSTAWAATALLAPVTALTADAKTFIFDLTEAMAPAAALLPHETMRMAAQVSVASAATSLVVTVAEDQWYAAKAALAPTTTAASTSTQWMAAPATLTPTTLLGADPRTFIFDLTEALAPVANFGSTSIQRMAATTALTPAPAITVNEDLLMAAKAALAPTTVLGADIVKAAANVWSGSALLTPLTTLTVAELLVSPAVAGLTPAAALTVQPQLQMPTSALLVPTTILLTTAQLQMPTSALLVPAPTLTVAETQRLTAASTMLPVTVLTAATTAWMAASATLTPAASFGGDARTFIFDLTETLLPAAALVAHETQMLAAVGLTSPTTAVAAIPALTQLIKAGLTPAAALGGDARVFYFSQILNWSVEGFLVNLTGLSLREAAAAVLAPTSTLASASAQWMQASTALSGSATLYGDLQKPGAVLWQALAGLTPLTTLSAVEYQLLATQAALAPAAALAVDARTFIFDLSEALAPTSALAVTAAALMPTNAALAPTPALTGAATQRMMTGAALAPVASFGADLRTFIFDLIEALAPVTTMGSGSTQRMAALTTLTPAPILLAAETMRLQTNAALTDAVALAPAQAQLTMPLLPLPLAPTTALGASIQDWIPVQAALVPVTGMTVALPIQRMAAPATLAPTTTAGATSAQWMQAASAVSGSATLYGDLQKPGAVLWQCLAGLNPAAALVPAEAMRQVTASALAPITALAATAVGRSPLAIGALTPFPALLVAETVRQATKAALTPTTAVAALETVRQATGTVLSPISLIAASAAQRMASAAALAPTSGLLAAEAQRLLGAAALVPISTLAANLSQLTPVQLSALLAPAAALVASLRQLETILSAQSPSATLAAAAAQRLAAQSSASIQAAVTVAETQRLTAAAALAPSTTFGADFGSVHQLPLNALLAALAALAATTKQVMAALSGLAPAPALGATTVARMPTSAGLTIAPALGQPSVQLQMPAAASFGAQAAMATATVQRLLAAAGLTGSTSLAATERQTLQARSALAPATHFMGSISPIPSFFIQWPAVTNLAANLTPYLGARSGFAVAPNLTISISQRLAAPATVTAAAEFDALIQQRLAAGAILHPDAALARSRLNQLEIIGPWPITVDTGLWSNFRQLHVKEISAIVTGQRGTQHATGMRSADGPLTGQRNSGAAKVTGMRSTTGAPLVGQRNAPHAGGRSDFIIEEEK